MYPPPAPAHPTPATGSTAPAAPNHPASAPPAPVAQRMIVPDVARGLMLWGIAVANVATAWVLMGGGAASTYGTVVNDSLLDKLTIMFTTSFVHARGFPMFSVLLGFGLGLIAMSLYRRGYPLGAARGVLARRYGLLAVFGLFHAVFLFWGDIMFAYGLLGLLMTTLIAVRTRTLLWIAGALFTVSCLVTLGAALYASSALGSDWASSGMDSASGFISINSYLDVMTTGLMFAGFVLVGLPIEGAMLLPLMLLGLVAAREGVLADPVRHRKVLVWTAALGMGTALATGIPAGLETIGVLNTGIFAMASASLGTAGGPGLIALLTLVLAGLQQRVSEGGKLPAPLWALSALGRRSMTGYMLQSVIFLVVFSSFALGLFAHEGAFVLFLVGTGGWLLTLALACALEAAGKKGPFEAVHRRLSYGKNGLAARWEPKVSAPAVPPVS